MHPDKNIVDVEFETVTTENMSGSVTSRAKSETVSNAEDIDADQLAVFGKKSTKPANKSLPLPLFTLIAAICSVGAFYLAGGYILFGHERAENPQETVIASTPTQDEQRLRIVEVTSNMIDRNNLKVLTIRATVANTDEIARTVPTIIVRLGDDPATGKMFRINRGETLEPGERLVFTNSLPVGNAPEAQPQLSFAE